MDFPESAPSADALTPGGDLQREVRILRAVVNLVLVALIILSGSLLLFFFRQVSLLRRQVEAASRVATQAVSNYKEGLEQPALQFERQLQEFARTNPEFQL